MQQVDEAFVLAMTKQFCDLRLKAREHNVRLDTYNAEQHEKKQHSSHSKLECGDFVMIKNCLGSKLDQPFIGPCKFVQYHEGQFSCDVRRPDGVTVTISVTKVVPCKQQLGVCESFEDMFQ